MNAQRCFVLCCYVLVFLSVWGIIACMGGTWTRRSFRDLCINITGLGLAITGLWLEACHHG